MDLIPEHFLNVIQISILIATVLVFSILKRFTPPKEKCTILKRFTPPKSKFTIKPIKYSTRFFSPNLKPWLYCGYFYPRYVTHAEVKNILKDLPKYSFIVHFCHPGCYGFYTLSEFLHESHTSEVEKSKFHPCIIKYKSKISIYYNAIPYLQAPRLMDLSICSIIQQLKSPDDVQFLKLPQLLRNRILEFSTDKSQ